MHENEPTQKDDCANSAIAATDSVFTEPKMRKPSLDISVSDKQGDQLEKENTDSTRHEQKRIRPQIDPSLGDKQRVQHGKEVNVQGDRNQVVQGDNNQVADNINNNYGPSYEDIKKIAEDVYKKSTEKVAPVAKASFALHDPAQCAAFGEQYKDSVHFAYVVVMSVFDCVLIRQIDGFVKRLMECLPTVTDQEGHARADRDAPFLAMNNILGVIGGCEFSTQYGMAVGFSENTASVLHNIWFHFPALRDSITSWLLDVNDLGDRKTTFETWQIANAFVNLIRLDYEDAENRFFNHLQASPNNIYLLSTIALELYQDMEYQQPIEELLLQWMLSSSWWLWKIPCNVYAQADNKNEAVCTQKLMDIMYSRFLEHYDDVCPFIGCSLYQSKRLRDVVARSLDNLLEVAQESPNDSILVAIAYLDLLRFGYYRVTAQFPALPLVACDNPDQHRQLRPLLEIMLAKRELRQALFSLLGAYLEEISEYNVAPKICKALQAFFFNAAVASPRHYQDILRFLQGEENTLSREIHSFLASHKNGFLKKGGN